jgi:hypothetical protein
MEARVLSTEAQERLRALSRTLEPGRTGALLAVLGGTLEKELRAWFAAANTEKPNRRNFPRQNFWAQVRTRTAYDPARTTANTATVVVADPRLRTHIYGGTLRATNSKYLAIPLNAEAYGKTPRSGLIAGLRFAPVGRTSNTVGYLVRHEGDKVVNYYRLVRKVTVRPDPSALPPASLTGGALLRAASAFIARPTA